MRHGYIVPDLGFFRNNEIELQIAGYRKSLYNIFMHDLAIAAPMLIRNKEEAHIVIETISAWSTLSYPIVVVDAGSRQEYIEKIRNLPSIEIYQTNRPFSTQIQLALYKASLLSDTVFFCQSDKLEFAKNTIVSMIDHYKTLPQKSVLIAARNKKSFSTYPLFQQQQETFLNETVAKFTQKSGDYLTGPKIFPSDVMKYLPHIKGEIGWGVEIFLTIIAHRLSLPIEFFEFFMSATSDIGGKEEIERYRIKVTQWELEGLIQALTVSL